MNAGRLLTLASLVAVALGGHVAPRARAEAGAISVPGYGPGIAGNVTIGPTAPVCQPDVPCSRPFAGANVVVLDDNGGDRQGRVVARAVTNRHGNFILSVRPGDYLVSVRTPGTLPACGDAPVTVTLRSFTLVTVDCDTGIR